MTLALGGDADTVKVRSKIGTAWTILLIIGSLAVLGYSLVAYNKALRDFNGGNYQANPGEIRGAITVRCLNVAFLMLTLWGGSPQISGWFHQLFNWAAAGLFIAANVTSHIALVSHELVELVVLGSILIILPFLVPMRYGLGFGRPYSIKENPARLPIVSPIPTSPMASMPAFVAPGVSSASPGFPTAPLAPGAPPAYGSPAGGYPPVYPSEMAMQYQYAGVATSPAPEYSKGLGDEPS